MMRTLLNLAPGGRALIAIPQVTEMERVATNGAKVQFAVTSH
jgi:hypothetical protein